jgi:hypothetical protein
MSVIANVRCNPVKGYSLNYNIEYIDNTRIKHRNIQYDYINVLKLLSFYFKSFSNYKTFLVPQHP